MAVTTGEVVIAGLLVFLAYKGRIAAEWGRVRKNTIWKAVNAWKRRRHVREQSNGV